MEMKIEKLKELIQKFGKEKINTLTKYPSILTLHKLGEKGRLLNDFTSIDIKNHNLFATEKIDGVNVRIVCYGEEFLIGSREQILHYSKDFYWGESLDIVKEFFKQNINLPKCENLTIFFGELYGGKTPLAKNYGKEKYGFRLFDVAKIDDLSILEQPIEKISAWRESSANSSIDDTLKYGQNFLTVNQLQEYSNLFEIVPNVEFELGDFSHSTILNNLYKFLPKTKVSLTNNALLQAEGIVLRNEDRSRIVKVRFEDYIRTLKK